MDDIEWHEQLAECWEACARARCRNGDAIGAWSAYRNANVCRMTAELLAVLDG